MRYQFNDSQDRLLNIREAPDKTASVVNHISSGTEFEGDDGKEWVKLSEPLFGFVMREYVSPVQGDETLQNMSVKELRSLAKESGIKLKAGLNKQGIIEAILNG